MRRVLLSVILAGMGTACHDHVTVCAGVGLVRFPPTDTTISVGASFILRYQEGGTCNPGHPAESDYHDVHLAWRTPDTAVVRLDSATARVTGLRTGDATLRPDGRDWKVLVHVR
jgi:hypothetical protein